MQLNSDTLEQRWAMLTNPLAMPVPPICRHTGIEIIDHLMLMDMLEESKPFGHERMTECRARFIRFCKTQWNCRDRN